ncbi:Short chain dehydrogenase sol3 [Lasiodiplodia theobromae]|uniref:Short chain dehydrogenase sol3 n=1 Tax=Lasiodiplodia theobromae TaxID=45133 RepID=A0A5N5CXS9_9PEZI|nr:Short chain dehydrogenase sol3 [Lasiodiplodia theobromae]
MGYATTFLYSQLFVKLPYPQSDFSDQVIIVTGSNTGLGLEAVKHLVRLRAARVILAVRSESKGQAAVEQVVAATKCSAKRLEVWPLDLSSYQSIKQFGERVRTLDRLDAVIQNAGILTTKWALAEDNESHITTNVISPMLIGLEVLPKLRESAQKTGLRGRLAFVGSDLQYIAKFSEKKHGASIFAALNKREIADMDDRYKVSKLLLLYGVRALAQLSPLTPESNVIIDNLTPGACKSDIFRDDVNWFQRIIMNLAISLIARTTEQGSRTLVHAVKPELGPEAHGAFLMDCKVAPNGANVDGPENAKLQDRFREELFTRLEQISPGITKL